ncbi:hypothetical protein E2C01_074273 [Portunus trituberculatus]|uniref:Uncharacterized protein n=1 Tax=Portunus trituberculatus TaxID=210409 RepID=A0A5B7ICW0_PORTR|nr:hypothetical protein [Portunus trituberculatus]
MGRGWIVDVNRKDWKRREVFFVMCDVEVITKAKPSTLPSTPLPHPVSPTPTSPNLASPIPASPSPTSLSFYALSFTQ